MKVYERVGGKVHQCFEKVLGSVVLVTLSVVIH